MVIYILFTNKQIREKLSCCYKKATALLRELETIGLIIRVLMASFNFHISKVQIAFYV